MYLHVRKVAELPESLESSDPFALVDDGRVELIHSECVGGLISIEHADDRITLVCSKCDGRQGLDRGEASEALLRVLTEDEYAWAGDAGFLPD
ncbi:MAG: hypothetical protein V3T72_07370 [Thermoanaerobaculia bacterium]